MLTADNRASTDQWADFEPVPARRTYTRRASDPQPKINIGREICSLNQAATALFDGTATVEPRYDPSRCLLALVPSSSATRLLRVHRGSKRGGCAGIFLRSVLTNLGYPKGFGGIFQAVPMHGGIVIDLLNPIEQRRCKEPTP